MKAARPKSVAGGIRAQNGRSIRGARTWWGREWLASLERFSVGARLGRGGNYARSGQVSELTIEPGLVQASVQGTQGTPYFCYIRFKVLEGDALESVAEAFASDPMMTAQVLTGVLPWRANELFERFQVPLFPQPKGDLWMHCTCPDYTVPCKHLMAALHLLGEAIARQPLRLLSLRGFDCLEKLVQSAPASDESAATLPDEALLPSTSATPDPGAILDQLGALPFWRGQERFGATLRAALTRAAPHGISLALGEAKISPRPPVSSVYISCK